MIDKKEFYLVSDSAHFFFAITAMTVPSLLGLRNPYISLLVILVFAAIKEAVIDPLMEAPEFRGSGLRDFAGYLIGSIVGLGVVCLRSIG